VGRGSPVVVVFSTDVRDRVDQVRDRERLWAPLGYRVGRWEGEQAEGIFPLRLVQADGDQLDGCLLVEDDDWRRCEGVQDLL
jgi:hypothetical protein